MSRVLKWHNIYIYIYITNQQNQTQVEIPKGSIKEIRSTPPGDSKGRHHKLIPRLWLTSNGRSLKRSMHVTCMIKCRRDGGCSSERVTLRGGGGTFFGAAAASGAALVEEAVLAARADAPRLAEPRRTASPMERRHARATEEDSIGRVGRETREGEDGTQRSARGRRRRGSMAAMRWVRPCRRGEQAEGTRA
jgi:hypothetical protein